MSAGNNHDLNKNNFMSSFFTFTMNFNNGRFFIYSVKCLKCLTLVPGVLSDFNVLGNTNILSISQIVARRL